MTGGTGLILNLYIDQKVKVHLDDHAETSRPIPEIGRGVCQEYCISPILLNLYRELANEALEGMSKIGVIETIKYADYLILLVKEEEGLQNILDWLVLTGRNYETEINIGKLKAMRISSRETSFESLGNQELENFEQSDT